MRKSLMIAVLIFFCLAGAGADARVADSRIAMGGINPGSTEAYVKRTYGPPKEVRRTYYEPRGQYIREYNYGDSFFIAVLENSGTVLYMMSLGRHNKIATIDGITVGSTLEAVLAAYGYPDLRQIDGDTDYYWYMGSGDKGNLVFHISFGRVTGIVCGGR